MNLRHLFQAHIAQTSPTPVGLAITRAEGCYLYDNDGRAYLDLIGGISVANVGHGHPDVVAAVAEQAATYMHVMVYGELIQSPQVRYAATLTEHLPETLNCVYFTNSGSEAVEGAIKLAKRVTGRPNMIACHRSYHGSTTGALSLMGDEYWRRPFRPLLPGVRHVAYNSEAMLEAVDEQTACVLIETVQAEAGVTLPSEHWLRALRQRCNDTGTLLVLDEIQCGFWRTGRLWAFERYEIVPDVLLLGKALGGGMPLGAFVADKVLLDAFTEDPVLGHITTFGGHPVCCAAGLAAFEALNHPDLEREVLRKEALFVSQLKHPAIRAVRACGLLLAVELDAPEQALALTQRALDAGLFTDWFLFAPHCIRIAPPLVISDGDIEKACRLLLTCLSA